MTVLRYPSARFRAAPLLVLVCALLVGCSSNSRSQPREWAHPRLDNATQAADRAECTRRAAAQVEKEEVRESPFLDEDRSTLQRMFARHDTEERRQELFANCLRDKGYVPVVENR